MVEEKDKKNCFGANEAQNLIDSTYNSMQYPIIEKTQNAYLMPDNMQRDVDCIDTFRFYEDTNEFTEELGIEGIPASPESKKKPRQP